MASPEYDNVCRLCLGADDGGIIPIFCGINDADVGRTSLACEIKACLSIQINEEDEFPKCICKLCLEKVKSWSIFKITCDEAQNKLRDSLKQCPREENPIDISFIKEEPIAIGEEELLNSEKDIASQFLPEITIKGEPKDIDENSSTIQIESITSNYEPPVEMLEVVPDLPQNYVNSLHNESDNVGPPILASLGLAPKGTILHRLRTPVVNLTPLELSDLYPMDTADSMDSADNSGSESHRLMNRRKLLNPKMNNCTICGLKFVSSGNARRHEKNVHKFYGLQPNPLNPEIIMNNSKSKSVMEPEILMEVDNDSVFQSVGENSDTEQFETFSGRQSITPEEGTELTEENIAYIHRHKDILEQVHERRCFCCNKGFGKLKTLLSHLRKKFVVPPFQCYNCLISCSNRSDYVQHIRQNQCRNLYSLYKSLPQDMMVKIETTIKTSQQKLKKSPVKIDKIPLKDALACKLFACNFCDLKNRLKAVIKKHLSTEHQTERDKPDNILQCSYCRKEFEDSESKKRHYGNADCTSHVICELCGERFETLPPFNDHASTVHATSITVRKMSGLYDSPSPLMANRLSKSQVTKCKYCPKTYSSYHNMLRHLKNHHNEINPYKCENCKETFRTKSSLVAHQETCLQTGINSQDEDDLQYNFSCKDCGVLFATLDGWTKHQEVHQACEQCGDTFQNIHELESHRKEHLKVKFYNCNICGNSYSQAEQLAEHMNEHGISEKEAADCKWYCEICDKPFDNPLDYSQHMKIHNEMPVLLTGLDGFNNPVETDKTIKTATKAMVNGKRSWYKCSLCSKRVETKQGLHRHMLYRHKKQMAGLDISKIGAYRCDLCPKRYANARGVLRHKKNSHPYARSVVPTAQVAIIPQQNMKQVPQLDSKFCNQCGLSGFNSQNDLNKHRLASHYPRGAKVCTICNLITNDAKKMWYHKKKYHAIPGSSNQCNICGKLFVTKPQFYAHIKNAHLKLPMEIEVTSTRPVHKYREPPQMVEFPEPLLNETGPWNCDLCPKIFSSVNALKSHRGWHLRTADGKSTGLGKVAPVWLPDQMSPSRIVKRMKFSTSTPGTSQETKYLTPKYKMVPKLPAGAYCRICNKTFSKITVYKRHVLEFHRPVKHSTKQTEINPQDLESIKKLYCLQCNESFQLKVDWIEHKVSHITKYVKEENLPQWPCICGKLFSRKDNLKSHMKTHMHGVPEFTNSSNVNKFYTCNPCRVSFTTAKELKIHTDSHAVNGNINVPRVLKCDFCGFMTEDIKLYQECRRAHHVPTKFKCEGCQIYFKNFSTLLKHHDENHQNDGVEPPTTNTGFECEKCGKTYSMKHHLKRHIDSAH